MGKKKYNVAVIGCGNIGAMYDLKKKDSELILSHCKAFNKNRRFNLLCCVDQDENKLKN